MFRQPNKPYIFLVDIGIAFLITFLALWANDIWGQGGGLDRYVLGYLAAGFHHWMLIFAVPVLLLIWYFSKRKVVQHLAIVLILVSCFLFFSEWVLISPVKTEFYWAWLNLGG